jgi:hypothetical protein
MYRQSNPEVANFPKKRAKKANWQLATKEQ